MSRLDVDAQLTEFATALIEDAGGIVDWQPGRSTATAFVPRELATSLGQHEGIIPRQMCSREEDGCHCRWEVSLSNLPHAHFEALFPPWCLRYRRPSGQEDGIRIHRGGILRLAECSRAKVLQGSADVDSLSCLVVSRDVAVRGNMGGR